MTSHSISKLCIRQNRKYYYRREAMIVLRWDEALKVERAAGCLRNRLMVRLCLFVGMRAHEIADAKVEHVDPINGLIYIPRGHFSGARFAAVDQRTLGLLLKYVGSRQCGPLLTREKGEPLTRWIVYYWVRKISERSGVFKDRPIGPLVLRRTHATEWLRRGGNIALLQKHLGHVHLESTAHYLIFLPDAHKAEHTRLFGPRKGVQAWRERVE